jgi:2-methylisocitrate lyase-like PEP mutase family enzyme
MADAVRRMAARVCIPVIADADTGYGDLHNVQRTVEAFEAAGTSGILLEDQVMPQRCGHFADKQVIPSEEMVLKIKAAVKVKSDPAFVIFARTAARQMNGLDDTIDRVNRCCDSGADIAFIEAPESRAELEEIAGGHGRTLINSIDPGTTFRVSFPLSGAQQERRDLFRSPSVQARFSCAPFPDRAEVDVACSNAKRNEFYWFRRRSNNQI